MRINEIKSFLAEAKIKNTHIEHVEDLIFNSGYAGANQAIEYVDSIRRMLKPGSGEPGRVTVKYDGAPAIVCGIDPADGKFFVGTKSVFGVREPKLIKKPSDVNKFYSSQPELAKKLLEALKYLRQLGIGGVLQGDFMFDEDSKSHALIDNEHMITFTPNTITYAAPVTSAFGKRIAKAKFGIIFHTRYEGETLQSMLPIFDVDVNGLNHVDSVWFDNADYKDVTGLATLTDEENNYLSSKIAAARSALNKIKPNKVNSVIFQKDLAVNFKPFVNHMVRTGQNPKDAMGFMKAFLDFYELGELEHMSKFKTGPTGKAAQRRMERMEATKTFAENNMNTILGIIAIYKNIIELKLDIINKLRQVEGLGVFLKSGDGYQVSNHEGFVAIGREGHVVKFVDRLDFSRQNFNAAKTWKKN